MSVSLDAIDDGDHPQADGRTGHRRHAPPRRHALSSHAPPCQGLSSLIFPSESERILDPEHEVIERTAMDTVIKPPVGRYDPSA